jgi:(p)ppGpp synthase/HD superfamily hydrolase
MKQLVEAAARLAAEVHEGTTDKFGRPYFEGHVVDVVHRVTEAGGSPEFVAAAYLHDVIEKTPLTLDDLTAAGMPDRVRNLVALLTHRPGQTRRDYLNAIRRDAAALLIKRADHDANADPDLLARVPDREAALLRNRYRRE